MSKKLLSQLLDENGNEILYSGTLVVDATTGKTFFEHVADKNAHPDFGDLAIQNKADIFADAVLTGTPVVPTAPAGTNTTQAASTEFVERAVNAVLGANDAMLFKGIVDGTHALPDEAYHTGWTYKVNEAGTYAGQACEIGDMVVCVSDFDTTAANADWVVVQRNIDGAVTGPTASTSDNVAVFDGATGKAIADSGITKASVSGAIAKAHEHANKAQLDAITATGAQVNQAVANSHTHANRSALDAIGTDSDGDLTFNGKALNGETGVAFVASAEETPVFTGKLRMVVADYTSPAGV